jgi:hypothetical protein
MQRPNACPRSPAQGSKLASSCARAPEATKTTADIAVNAAMTKKSLNIFLSPAE